MKRLIKKALLCIQIIFLEKEKTNLKIEKNKEIGLNITKNNLFPKEKEFFLIFDETFSKSFKEKEFFFKTV